MTRSAATLPLDYPRLHGLIRKNASCYVDDFAAQYRNFTSAIDLLRTAASSKIDNLEPLIIFLSQTAHYYPQVAAAFPSTCYELLSNDSFVDAVDPLIRKALVQALMQVGSLKNKHCIPQGKVLTLLFRLFRVKDKQLGQLLLSSIVADITKANKQRRDNSLNRTLQNFMYNVMTSEGQLISGDDAHSVAAFKSLQVIIELYRRRVWSDPRTVNIVALAAVDRANIKMMQLALHFFLGKMPKLSIDEDSDSVMLSGDSLAKSKLDLGKINERRRELTLSCNVSGLTKSRKRKLKRLNAATRRASAQNDGSEGEGDNEDDDSPAMSIIQMLNDPQSFAEKIHANLKKSNDTFDCKLLMMSVLSRVIGVHCLLISDFYPVLQRYLHPNQKDVLQVLAFAAQAAHDQMPSQEVLFPVVRIIANNFVADHNQPTVIAAGLNGIREICNRNINAMDETLLSELIEYASPKRNHHKGVMMAARSLIGLYREKRPEMLPKRERGKEAVVQMLQSKRKLEDIERDLEEEGQSGSEGILGDSGDDLSNGLVSEDEEFAALSPEQLPLAATKILTREELKAVKANELRPFSGTTAVLQGHSSISPELIAGPVKGKADYAARMASILEGRKDRPEFGSSRRGQDRVSVPNREQAKRSKPQTMMAHKHSIRAKSRRSASQKLGAQQAHRKRQKLRK